MTREFRGNFNAPVVGGDNSGTINSVSGPFTVASAGELVERLRELRAAVDRAEVPRREVVRDYLDDLAADAEALADPERAGEVEPAVVRSRWEKVKSLLDGVAGVAEPLARIGTQLGPLLGA